MTRASRMAVALALVSAAPAATAQTPLAPEPVAERIRTAIEAFGWPPRIVIGGDRLHASQALPRFYERRGYRAAWIHDGRASRAAGELLDAIDASYHEGLWPADYHRAAIQGRLDALRDAAAPAPDRLAELDLLLTDAYLVLASHYLAGRVDPVEIDPEWHASPDGADLPAVLEAALRDGQVRRSLQALLPPQPAYQALRTSLRRYRAIAQRGGWPQVPGRTMRRGDRGPGVVALRQRLAAGGDLRTLLGPGDRDIFDEATERAVRRFQRRHGLPEDGVANLPTLVILAEPVEKRIEQIRLNMERWRWLPQDLGARHILVNIASFELDVVEGDESVLNMRVMVGQRYRKTPVFSDRMTYLVFSPYWHVPPQIAVNDKLPLIRQDPGYLRANRMKVFPGWGADTREIDPSTVNWATVRTDPLPYRFRMDPGPDNPLGGVKFMFPNRFHVYLHDTNTRDLFVKQDRAFSSGCIRIEKPVELAEYLLAADPAWNRDAIERAMRSGVERTVGLPAAVPVHLLYWTAWVDGEGLVHFRRDIYQRDAQLARALDAPAPAAADLALESREAS